MSAQQNKALVRRYYEELWNQRQIGVADTLFAPDFRIWPDAQPGTAGVKQFVARPLEVIPDLRVRVDDLIADEGEKVVARFVISGTHLGILFGVPATGKTLEITEITVWRVRNGTIVERWTVADALGALHQVGSRVVPP